MAYAKWIGGGGGHASIDQDTLWPEAYQPYGQLRFKGKDIP